MVNWGGAAGGATSGAAAGSAFGPWGAAGGAVLGGLGGLFSGSKDKIKNLDALLPQQKDYLLNILNQLQGQDQGSIGGNYGMANDYLSQILSGSPEAFERFAAPYRTEFEQQTIPRLAERFAGLGGGLGGGALGSSGFGQALGGAGAQFQSNLAGLYAQLQQQAAQQAMGQYNTLSNLGLGTNAFVMANRPGSLGFGGTSAAGLSQGIGSGIGQGIGTGLSNRFADYFGNKSGNTTNNNAANTPNIVTG